jgi:hypothetical protein
MRSNMQFTRHFWIISKMVTKRDSGTRLEQTNPLRYIGFTVMSVKPRQLLVFRIPNRRFQMTRQFLLCEVSVWVKISAAAIWIRAWIPVPVFTSRFSEERRMFSHHIPPQKVYAFIWTLQWTQNHFWPTRPSPYLTLSHNIAFSAKRQRKYR